MCPTSLKQHIYEKEAIQQQKSLKLYPDPVFQKGGCALVKRLPHKSCQIDHNGPYLGYKSVRSGFF